MARALPLIALASALAACGASNASPGGSDAAADAAESDSADSSSPADDASGSDATASDDASADATADAPDLDAPPDVAFDGGCLTSEQPIDAIGVFAAPSGDDNAAGTRAAPFKTAQHAFDVARATGKSHVYLAAGSYDHLDMSDATPAIVASGHWFVVGGQWFRGCASDPRAVTYLGSGVTATSVHGGGLEHLAVTATTPLPGFYPDIPGGTAMPLVVRGAGSTFSLLDVQIAAPSGSDATQPSTQNDSNGTVLCDGIDACSDGANGTTPPAGASATKGVGTFTEDGHYLTEDGQPGAAGTDGRNGSAGGAGATSSTCSVCNGASCATMTVSAGQGTCGCGGLAGVGGRPGLGGGGSIGMLVTGAGTVVNVTASTIYASSGGRGQLGGAGANGASGGTSIAGYPATCFGACTSTPSCTTSSGTTLAGGTAGGAGGHGARGSNGGGGGGGPAIAIATVDHPTVDVDSASKIDVLGSGGDGAVQGIAVTRYDQ